MLSPLCHKGQGPHPLLFYLALPLFVFFIRHVLPFLDFESQSIISCLNMSHSAADRAQSLRKPNWAEHKDAIEDLYLKQKNTLKGVMKVMEARGFNARSVNLPETHFQTDLLRALQWSSAVKLICHKHAVNSSTRSNSLNGGFPNTRKGGTLEMAEAIPAEVRLKK